MVQRYSVYAILGLLLALGGVLALAQPDSPPPFIGVAFAPDGESGLIIQEIEDGSPAADADLQAGDILVAIDGTAITADNLPGVLADYAPGDTAELLLLRDGESLTAELTFGARSPALDELNLMETLRSLSYTEPRPTLGIAIDNLAGTPGVQVINVIDGSPAAAAGLQAGDIILAANGEDIVNSTQFVGFIGTQEPGAAITLTVQRGGQRMTLEATVGQSPARAYIRPR